MTRDELVKMFQEQVGRDPSTAETQYFLGAVDKGYLNPYTAGIAMQGTPDAQQRFLGQQEKLMQDRMAQSDMQQLGMARDTLTSQFLNQGRRYSSGYTAAFADAAQNLAMARQQATAGFYSQGLGNIGQGRAEMGQQFLNEPFRRAEDERKYQQDLGLAQYWYTRQSNDYQDQLNAQKRAQKQGAWIGLGSSLLGAAAGGFMGGGVGALAGGMLGGGLGQQIGRGSTGY